MQKKVLYGTTALIAVGMAAGSASAAEKIKIGVGGFMQQGFGYTNGDVSGDGFDHNEFGAYSNNEIHFDGSTTLDNGIKVAVHIELEGETSGDQIDEQYLTLSGGFGQMIIGSENTAAYKMQYGAPNVGLPLNSGWLSAFIPFTGVGGTAFRTAFLSTYVDIGNDDFAITYFTPRIAGFQLGASYVPNAGGGTTGSGSSIGAQANESTVYHNGFSVGVNFVETLGPVDVAIAGGYGRIDAPDQRTNAFNGITQGIDDYQSISGGINLGFAGVTIGASIANVTDGKQSGGGSGQIDTEGTAYDAGISYGQGPWAVSGTYFHGSREGLNFTPDDDELDAFSIAASYALGPGISTSLSAFYIELESEETGFRGGAGSVGVPPQLPNGTGENDADAMGVMGLIKVSF